MMIKKYKLFFIVFVAAVVFIFTGHSLLQKNVSEVKDFSCDSNDAISGGSSSTKGDSHTYYGYLAEGVPIKIMLSCDRTKLIISGSVNQTIDGNSVFVEGDPLVELTDVSNGSEVVSIAFDYNFDGYNDLQSVFSSGQGVQALSSSVVFLYDPQKKEFILNDDLSSIFNISVSSTTREIIEHVYTFDQHTDTVTDKRTYYVWNSGRLEKIKTENFQEVTDQGRCYVGGCSSEICSDKPDVMSNCMYREEYACYKNAVCERQATGKCGWTNNTSLQMCLKNKVSQAQ